MPRRQVAFLVILNLVFIMVLLVSRVEEHIEGVWSLELVGRCYLDYHVSIQSVGLACPGVEVQPWPDPTDWPEGPGWLVESPLAKAGFCLARNSWSFHRIIECGGANVLY
jgi:hypothetical protein